MNLESLTNTNEEEFNKKVHELYLDYLEKGELGKLRELRGITNIEFNKEYVQKHYFNLLQKGEIRKIKDVQEITGVKPKLPKKLVREYYKNKIQKRDLWDLHLVRQITNIKSKIPTKDIQKAYEYFVNKEGFHDVESLYEVTRIRPKIPEKIIQNWYAKMLKEYYFEIEDLYKITWIKPREDIIQKAYEECIDALLPKMDIELFNNLLVNSLDRIDTLYRSTKIKPNLPEDKLQKCYDKIMMKSCRIRNSIKDLENITRVKVSPESIQECYKYYLMGGPSYLKKFEKEIGVTPLEINVHKAYLEHAKSGNFFYIQEIEKETGIKPTKEVHEAIRNYIQEKWRNRK